MWAIRLAAFLICFSLAGVAWDTLREAKRLWLDFGLGSVSLMTQGLKGKTEVASCPEPCLPGVEASTTFVAHPEPGVSGSAELVLSKWWFLPSADLGIMDFPNSIDVTMRARPYLPGVPEFLVTFADKSGQSASFHCPVMPPGTLVDYRFDNIVRMSPAYNVEVDFHNLRQVRIKFEVPHEAGQKLDANPAPRLWLALDGFARGGLEGSVRCVLR
jgi:hypothetical protein